MSLISRDDLIKVSGLSKTGFLKNSIASAMMRITKITKVNELYDKLKDKIGKDFFDFQKGLRKLRKVPWVLFFLRENSPSL